MNPSPDPHDDHLRRLLDQRSARADISSFPSMSDFSDTPSVYSRAFFSPRPVDLHHADEHLAPHSASRRSSNVQPERNRLNDLAVSMLDLDDESQH